MENPIVRRHFALGSELGSTGKHRPDAHDLSHYVGHDDTFCIRQRLLVNTDRPAYVASIRLSPGFTQ